MPPGIESDVAKVVESLRTALGDNLYSCCLYGSAVRGTSVEGVSDINLLIVLNRSDPAAQQAIAGVLRDFPLVDPFILARTGFERSVRAFATKFESIGRHHRVLHGADPLAGINIDSSCRRFLCEQALRNLRLRLVHSFVTRHRHKAYGLFLRNNITGLFVHLTEVLRLEGRGIPVDFTDRIPLLAAEFHFDGQVLRDLQALKQERPKRFSDAESVQWHERLFPVIDAVLHWIEQHWPA